MLCDCICRKAAQMTASRGDRVGKGVYSTWKGGNQREQEMEVGKPCLKVLRGKVGKQKYLEACMSVKALIPQRGHRLAGVKKVGNSWVFNYKQGEKQEKDLESDRAELSLGSFLVVYEVGINNSKHR